MTSSNRRNLLRTGAVILSSFAIAAFPTLGRAQGWPNKPIRLIVGFAPGGVADIMTRSLALRLSAQLSTPVIVDNKPGADSLIASQIVAGAEPDGYTLYVASTAHAVNQNMYKKPGFDAVRDFTHMSTFTDVPNVIAVHPSLPVKTLREFIAYAKARKGQLNYSSSASGTFLTTELFTRAAGIELQRVPYKGAAPAIAALVANDVHMTVTGIGGVAQLAGANKVRILAVASPRRNPLAPEVPTTTEAGLPNHFSGTWYALLGPARMPKELVERINGEARKILSDAEFINGLNKIGATGQASTPTELESFMRSEVESWRKAIVETNAPVE